MIKVEKSKKFGYVTSLCSGKEVLVKYGMGYTLARSIDALKVLKDIQVAKKMQELTELRGRLESVEGELEKLLGANFEVYEDYPRECE